MVVANFFMRCPVCNYKDSKVLDSRLSEHDNAVRRRRACPRCRFRFSTLETTEILDLSVIKRDGRREAYSRSKIQAGLERALEKRPISRQEFQALLSAIERDIYVLGRAEIKTSEIGEIVMRRLRGLDQVAYIRFASVYRAFRDVEHFRDEISRLVAKRRRKKVAPKKSIIKRNKE